VVGALDGETTTEGVGEEMVVGAVVVEVGAGVGAVVVGVCGAGFEVPEVPADRTLPARLPSGLVAFKDDASVLVATRSFVDAQPAVRAAARRASAAPRAGRRKRAADRGRVRSAGLLDVGVGMGALLNVGTLPVCNVGAPDRRRRPSVRDSPAGRAGVALRRRLGAKGGGAMRVARGKVRS